jgi:hypothetical protein
MSLPCIDLGAGCPLAWSPLAHQVLVDPLYKRYAMVLGLDGFQCRNPFTAFPLGTCLLGVPSGRSDVGYAAHRSLLGKHYSTSVGTDGVARSLLRRVGSRCAPGLTMVSLLGTSTSVEALFGSFCEVTALCDPGTGLFRCSTISGEFFSQMVSLWSMAGLRSINTQNPGIVTPRLAGSQALLLQGDCTPDSGVFFRPKTIHPLLPGRGRCPPPVSRNPKSMQGPGLGDGPSAESRYRVPGPIARIAEGQVPHWVLLQGPRP